MTSSRLTTILEELRAEEVELQEGLEALRGQIKDGESQLSQVRKAMSSLKGNPSSLTRASKLPASREEVLTAITEVLREQGSVSDADLRRFVEQRVSALGRSRMGLAMRFKSALKQPGFIRKGNMVSLSQSSELAEVSVDRGTR